MDVVSTFVECCGHQINVETTLCSYWVVEKALVLPEATLTNGAKKIIFVKKSFRVILSFP